MQIMLFVGKNSLAMSPIVVPLSMHVPPAMKFNNACPTCNEMLLNFTFESDDENEQQNDHGE
jgi:hypothetical protein